MSERTPLHVASDGIKRCFWCGDDPEYIRYHDEEWGRPLVDEHRLYEKLCLEGFQAGLSWLTILRKRQNFRRAFHGFDPIKVARMNARDVERLLEDEGIVRHRGKIESAINNAARALELQEECGSLAAYVWSYEPSKRPPAGQPVADEAVRMSKDLKKRGWSFVGPTTVYAFMQSSGLVNDHFAGCAQHKISERARAEFTRPQIGAPR